MPHLRQLLKANNIRGIILSDSLNSHNILNAVPLIFKSDLHIKTLAISSALTPREGYYFFKVREFLPFKIGNLRSCAAHRVRFRGLISGREIVNMLKSRTERTLLTISLQFKP